MTASGMTRPVTGMTDRLSSATPVAVLEAAGVPYGPGYDYAQMFADPQVRHRGLVQYASDMELGEVPHTRTPVRIGEGVRVRTVARSSESTMPRSSAGSG